MIDCTLVVAMAEIILDDGTVFNVVWDGENLIINGEKAAVSPWWRAVFNYSAFEEVIKKYVVDLLETAGFRVSRVKGKWRV